MTKCETLGNTKKIALLDIPFTSQNNFKRDIDDTVELKSYEHKKEDSEQEHYPFCEQDDLYVLTFDESESRIIFLLIILFGLMSILSICFMSIVHLITFEELPVVVQPIIPSSKTKGTNNSKEV